MIQNEDVDKNTEHDSEYIQWWTNQIPLDASNSSPEESNAKPMEVATRNNIVKLFDNINEKDLPSIIGGQVQKLKDLDNRIERAWREAKHAQKKAQSASEKSAGWGKKKAAIEELQEAVVGISSATTTNAEIGKKIFEFQSQLVEINKYLFALGVGSIALNRSVVRQLQLKLDGAPKEKMSELVKGEIITVIKQLKAQEDILAKQEFITKKTKEHNDELQKLSKRIENVERYGDKLQNLSKKIESLEDKLTNIDESVQIAAESNIQFRKLKNLLYISFSVIGVMLIAVLLLFIFSK